MTTDLILAVAHHLLVFSIAGVIAAEMALARPGITRPALSALGRIDGAYGGLAVAVILVGIGRVLFGFKGWEFYVYSWSFWGKMAAFVAVGLLSIPPTMRIITWRRAAATSGDYTVPDSGIAKIRTFIKAQAAVFTLILLFAAMMARAASATELPPQARRAA